MINSELFVVYICMNKKGKNTICATRLHELASFFESVAIIAMMLIICIKPSQYINSFSEGLKIFSGSVLPAMLPFFIFTRVLYSLGWGKKMGLMLGKPLSKLFNAPPSCGYVFAMSLLGGYPIGAKLTEGLYSAGEISTEEALKLTSFCSGAGPIFIMGTLGGVIFKSTRFALVILLANYLSSILNGLLWRGKRKYYSIGYGTNENNPDPIIDSIFSALCVGTYIALFNLLCEILSRIGLIDFISSSLLKINFIHNKELVEGVVFGIIEVTKGCLTLSSLGITKVSACLTAGIISFGGIGILCQSMSFLKKCKIKTWAFLLRKITQALFAILIAYLLCLAFNIT